MFVIYGKWCLADVSNVSPSLEGLGAEGLLTTVRRDLCLFFQPRSCDNKISLHCVELKFEPVYSYVHFQQTENLFQVLLKNKGF